MTTPFDKLAITRGLSIVTIKVLHQGKRVLRIEKNCYSRFYYEPIEMQTDNANDRRNSLIERREDIVVDIKKIHYFSR